MAKQYYIKKDPSATGSDIEWAAINGKEFYKLITSPAGKGRYFIDMDEFIIESTKAEYKDWRKEKITAITCVNRKLKSNSYLCMAAETAVRESLFQIRPPALRSRQRILLSGRL